MQNMERDKHWAFKQFISTSKFWIHKSIQEVSNSTTQYFVFPFHIRNPNSEVPRELSE